jgi:hypothetical protein
MKAGVLALLLAAGTAHADEIVVHTVSWHMRDREDYTLTYIRPDGTVDHVEHIPQRYNNINPGLGYRWDSGWNVGYYDNSYGKPAFYVVKDWQWNARWGVVLGVASGYKEENRTGFVPLVALTFRQPITDAVSLNVQALPPISNSAGVVHLTVNYALQR